jgi:NTP pyrophosphatase (non-canonical NTP hydrolase)
MTDAELRQHIEQHLAWCPDAEARLPFLALALCGEAGELANLVKKQWRGDAGDRYAEIVSELADVGNYAFMLASHFGIDLQAAMLAKLIEVERRPSWWERKMSTYVVNISSLEVEALSLVRSIAGGRSPTTGFLAHVAAKRHR